MITTTEKSYLGDMVLDVVKEWLDNESIAPQELFDDDVLRQWATENNFVSVSEVEDRINAAVTEALQERDEKE